MGKDSLTARGIAGTCLAVEDLNVLPHQAEHVCLFPAHPAVIGLELPLILLLRVAPPEIDLSKGSSCSGFHGENARCYTTRSSKQPEWSL